MLPPELRAMRIPRWGLPEPRAARRQVPPARGRLRRAPCTASYMRSLMASLPIDEDCDRRGLRLTASLPRTEAAALRPRAPTQHAPPRRAPRSREKPPLGPPFLLIEMGTRSLHFVGRVDPRGTDRLQAFRLPNSSRNVGGAVRRSCPSEQDAGGIIAPHVPSKAGVENIFACVAAKGTNRAAGPQSALSRRNNPIPRLAARFSPRREASPRGAVAMVTNLRLER